MSFARCLGVLLCLLFAGCEPVSQKGGDEQKEPYFLAAKKRSLERDFQGAIEYFEKALDENPRSASAHFELAILYEQNQNDWAAALYHYTRVLRLRPDYNSADVIKQRIEYCKRELAKSVVQLPSVEVLQRKVDFLTKENQDLKTYLQAWQNYYAGRSNAVQQAPAPAPVPAQNLTPAAPLSNALVRPRTALEPRETSAPPAILTRVPAPARTSRLHTVANGETLDKIARKYGVRVSALMAANPTVDARRMRPGQTLVIPTSAP